MKAYCFIVWFFSDDSKLKDRIDETEKKLEALEETLSKVDQEIEETDDLVQAAERNTTDIKEKIEHAVVKIQVNFLYFNLLLYV